MLTEYLKKLSAQARITGDLAYLDALNDRSIWNAIPQSFQDHVIEVACSCLSPNYSWIETIKYTCGDAKCRIATFLHEPTGLIFHLLPGGTYLMGSSGSYFDFESEGLLNQNLQETPVHPVSIKPFLISKAPVTSLHWNLHEEGIPSDLPLENVSWYECRNWLFSFDLRLPSESEWEYACRAGGSGLWTFGSDEENLSSYAVFDRGDFRPFGAERVGQKLPNAFGLHDMHGNVSEWCEDCVSKDYGSAPKDGTPQFKSLAGRKIYRGGSWIDIGYQTRSTVRQGTNPEVKAYCLGFRAAANFDFL